MKAEKRQRQLQIRKLGQQMHDTDEYGDIQSKEAKVYAKRQSNLDRRIKGSRSALVRDPRKKPFCSFNSHGNLLALPRKYQEEIIRCWSIPFPVNDTMFHTSLTEIKNDVWSERSWNY